MAETVKLLETGECSTMVSTWRDHVYLTRRKDGTCTLKLHRRSIGEPGYGYLYRSEPFRTAGAFLDALKEAEHQTMCGFASDLASILGEAQTLDAALATHARVLLARCPWEDWDPEVESYQVTMSDLKNAP